MLGDKNTGETLMSSSVYTKTLCLFKIRHDKVIKFYIINGIA